MKRNPEISIRIATSEDAAALLPMFEAFYGPHLKVHSPETIRARMREAASVDMVLIAHLDGRPAGFASLRLIPQIETDRPHAELSDLFVVDAYRRRGVGRGLMQSAENLARERKATRLVLTTGLDNPGARAFYAALGYHEFGVTESKSLEESR